MKKIFTCIFCAVLAISSWGTEYQVGSDDYDASTGPTDVYYNHFISQILYLQSSITATGAEAGSITSISFWVKSSVAQTRKIEVYISASSATQLSEFTSQSANNKLFEGNVNVPANGWYTISLTKSFTWDGSSNLLITINDKTNAWKSSNTKHYGLYSGAFGKNQIAYVGKTSGSAYDATNITATATLSKYYPTIKFNIETTSPTPTYAAPTNVSVTAKSSSTATIGWTKKDDAKIKLQYSVKDADSWTTVENLTGASYTISGLSSETTYDYKVFAVYTEGTSDAVTGSFTTDAVSDHEHNGVSFQEWKETESLPTTAGSYYLKDNVTVSSWTVPTGDTKICLNGKTITYTNTISPITIGDSKSLSIYDNEGDGKITAALNFAATIKINAGGTLSLYGGTIENTATAGSASAIHVASSTGTFNLQGNVKMSTSSNAANINLQYGKITLTGAITNTTKLSVYKAANANITSGWKTQMGSANPADYFTSANSAAPAVILVGDEAQLGVPSFEFSETGEYTSYPSGKTDVNLIRTFQGGILNTISLPFALTDEQMKDAFGEDYELYQLSSSALSNNILDIYFDKVTTLELGYPYLLKVSENIVNPSFSSVTFGTASHRTSTTAIDMVSVVKEQQVTGSNYNLFLNASGELNWSTQDALFKGMRAYFQIKEGYRDAVAARRLVIRSTPTDLKGIDNNPKVEKIIENGHLIILKNGKKHTMQGQIIK